MKQSQRWINLQICPRQDSNTGGSYLWSNTLPLEHGGTQVAYKKLGLFIHSVILIILTILFAVWNVV